MEEKRPKHFKVAEVKEQILQYVLRREMPAKEREITDYLKERYSLDRATVNRHLHDLADLKCVTKVTPIKSRFNYWDAEFKNFKHIEKEFPGIRLSDYTKAKSVLINENFPDIHGRLYKKYFIYMSLFPSLFDTFFNSEFEPMLKRADELWEIKDYKEIIDSKIDQVYNELFLLDDWVNPLFPRIEVSKEEFQMAIDEIPYPYKEDDENKQEETIKQGLLKNLTKIVLSKRPNGTKDQVKKEVSEKIINHIWHPYQDFIDDIIHYQHLRRYKICDKVCRHFYETDFLKGISNPDAKMFINKLEDCIKTVNEAFNQAPTSEEPKPVEKFQTRVNELDSIYNEYYEKCLQKDKSQKTMYF